MAAGRRAGRAVRSLGAALLLAAAVAPAVAGADPNPSPARTLSRAPATPTCAERYPADGPAGVDLLLGCVARELVRYAGGLGGRFDPAKEPPRLSEYLVPAAMIAAAVVAVLLVVRVARQDAGRRLAPAAPAAWWSCPACRSLNAAGNPACYRCGHVFEAGATEMRVDAEPLAPQSFGRRFDLGISDQPPAPPVERQPARPIGGRGAPPPPDTRSA